MKRIFKIFLILIVLLSIFTTNAKDSGERKIIAGFPTWKPYGYMENGKATGFEIEVFSEVMKKMNYKVEYQHLPWKRCLLLAKSGEIDVVISALKVKEREEYLYYPNENISMNTSALFVTKDNQNIKFDGDFRNLEKYIIGVTRGFSYGKEFDEAIYLKKSTSTDVRGVIRMLIGKRFKIGAGNIPTVMTTAKDMGVMDQILFMRPFLHSSKLYVGFSKKSKISKNLYQKFSKELKIFKKSVKHKELKRKYHFTSRVPCCSKVIKAKENQKLFM